MYCKIKKAVIYFNCGGAEMGFRFKKSIKIAPGVKLNLNKKSTGITIGGKGVHYTFNSKGKRTASIGIPGTGLSYSSSNGDKSSKKNRNREENFVGEAGGSNSMKNKKSKKGCLPAVIISVVLVGIIGSCGGGDNVTETTEAITTVIEAVITSEHTTSIPVTSERTTMDENSVSTQKGTSTEKNTTTTEKNTTTTKKAATAKEETITNKATTTRKVTTTKKMTTKAATVYNGPENGEMVWIPESGKKYHNDPSCSNMNNPSKVSVSEAENMGYTPCKKCY